MSTLRKILFPFSILYDGVTVIRNKLFDAGIFKSTKFSIPVIVVGNLSVGGTGKTPQIEYLVRLLKDTYKIAVLSRGYKRKSTGFFLADENSNSDQIGDEPFQFYNKFKDVYIAVDEARVNGINELQKLENPPDIVLLDDAFQHRKVDAGFNILLTPFNDLYVNDLILPAGNLRESKRGAKRADVVVVTKCPKNISIIQQQKIAQKLKLNKNQQLFFTTISYSDSVKNERGSQLLKELKDTEILLVTGIANPTPLVSYIKSKGLTFKHLEFSDHHNFEKCDVDKINVEFNKITSKNKLILTTEKDYGKLNNKLSISYLEIEAAFISNGNEFNKIIKNYVE